MSLQGTAIINLLIGEAGIMICIFALITIWFGSSKYMSTKKYMTAAFSSMLLYNLCLLLLELSQAVANLVAGPPAGPAAGPWRTGVILVGFGTYLFPQITVYIISRYVVRVVFEEGPARRRLYLLLNILGIAAVAVLLAAQFAGILLIVDDAGRYTDGPALPLGYVLVAIFMIIDMIITIRFAQMIPPYQRYAFAAYLALPLLSMVVRVFCPDVYIVALSSCIAMMIMLVVIVNAQSRSLAQQERDNEQLKVDLMLSQIQPHFLFNILYVIQEICLIDAETASKAIADFSRYLRHNMDSISINSPIPFKEELEHVKHYVSLQQLRFGDALDVRYELKCTDFELPTLTLQPLVENAIRYGVRKSVEGEGTVTVRTEEFPDHYEVHVIDDGPGFVPGQLPEDGMSHMGLRNVRGRLARICNGELIIKSEPGKGTDAAIVLPK